MASKITIRQWRALKEKDEAILSALAMIQAGATRAAVQALSAVLGPEALKRAREMFKPKE